MSELSAGMVPAVIKTSVINYGTVYPSDIVGPTVIGLNQFRSPEPSGCFVPGVFRVNPVRMYKDLGSYEPAQLRARVIGGGSTANPEYVWTEEGPSLAENRPWSLKPNPDLAKWAIQEAFAKMNEPQVGVALILAELGETLRMLRNPIKALTDLTKRIPVKRSKTITEFMPDHQDTGKAIDALGGSWLTFKYGIVPLMLDIQQILDAVKHGLRKLDQLTTFKGGIAGDESVTSYTGTRTNSVFTVRWRTDVTVKHSAFSSVYAFAKVDASSPVNFGFDAMQLLQLIWEVTPYSFVVDWFAGVGNWLGTLTPSLNFTYLGNSVSIKSEYIAKTVATNVSMSGAELLESNAGTFTRTVTQLQRQVNLPVPALPVLNPNFLDIQKSISAAALAWQQIPKRWRHKI